MKFCYRIFIMLCAFCAMLSLNRIANNTTPPDRPVNLVVWSTNTVTITNHINIPNVVNRLEWKPMSMPMPFITTNPGGLFTPTAVKPVHLFTNHQGREWWDEPN